ncbi:MAG TPA: MDR family MFS transporter [Microvirga sp.]|jgi:EmrB/QacA subfamily drug resistance transporter|nr:MDR family MFS transporter [Microvirga sp.]
MDQQNPFIRPQEAELSHGEIRLVLAGILLAMLLAALDQTIIATALPTIGRELGDLEHLSWVVTIYLLTSTAVTPLYGKIADSHGRRITMLVGIVVFIVGSIACALATTMWALILARGLQGLGGGGLIALGQTIIADLVPPRERAKYQVYFASVFMTSSLVGPVLGGFFADHLHWSVIFWINLPLGLLAFAISFQTLKRLPRVERPHRLDLAGAALLVAATLSLLLALSWGGVRYPWFSVPVLGLVAASLALWAAFIRRMRRAPEPLIPAGVLNNPVVRMGTLAACFGMGTYIGLTIYLPVYFETVRGLSASASGLALIPLMVGTVVGATISGRVMTAMRHYKRLPVVGLLVAALVTALLAATAERLPLAGIEIMLAVLSVGLGTLLPVSTVAIQNAVQPHELGTATGTANFFRSLGGALIVAAFGAIILGGTGLAGQALSFETLGRTAAESGIDLGGIFRLVFAAAALGFALALVFLWRMEERPLKGRAPGETRGA